MRWAAPAVRAIRRVGGTAATRVRERGRSALVRALRLTTAAVSAYVVAHWLFPGTQPLVAPLTALLVVQVTLYGVLTNSVQRVASVIAGVLLAVGFASVVGLTWWSLGILVAASIITGQLLRLGPHLLEVPISAMLMLAVGAVESVAGTRVVETLIGAGIGVLVNLIAPPKVQTGRAGYEVERFAAEIADLLENAGRGLTEGAPIDQARHWLDDARRLNRHIPRLDTAVRQAEESRRLNPRALITPDAGPSLRDALEALEHCSVAVRVLFRSIVDGMRAFPDEDGAGAGDGDASAVRMAFAALLHALGVAVRSFGHLVRAEVESAGEPAEEAELRRALDALREARAMVTELLLVDPRDAPGLWALNSSLLSTVERMLHELDVEEHARARRRVDADRSRLGRAMDRLLPDSPSGPAESRLE